MLRRSAFSLIALASVLAATPAEAGRRPRTGTVVSPFGPIYNTGSAEWRMAGGNPILYEQIMEQKMLMQQQQMMLKQQQQMLKAQQSKAKAGSPTAGSSPTGSLNLAPPAHKKKKRRTYVPTGNPATKPAETKPGTTAPAAKPGTP